MKAPKAADFKVHAPVWVKLGSYPWWPARVAPDTSGVVHKAKKVHVIFFGDDTESWVDVKKIRVFDDAPQQGKGGKGVAEALEEAHQWIAAGPPAGSGSGSDSDSDGGDESQSGQAAAQGGDDDGGGAQPAAAAQQSAAAPPAQAAAAELAPDVAPDGSAPMEVSGEGVAAAGGDDAAEEEEEDDDGDDDDDDGDDDGDSELSLSDDSDAEPAFEPQERKRKSSAGKAGKRKDAGRAGGSPAAKRARGDSRAARYKAKEERDEPPILPTELRDASIDELAKLRATADEGVSEFSEAGELLANVNAKIQGLQEKMDKMKGKKKKIVKAQEEAKRKVHRSLKEVGGCKMSVAAMKQTKWGKAVNKLSKFDDGKISRLATAQLNSWKEQAQAEQTQASVEPAAAQGDAAAAAPAPAAEPGASTPPIPSARPQVAADAGAGAQAEATAAPPAESNGVAAAAQPPSPKPAEVAGAASAEDEAAAAEKLRAKARALLARALGLPADAEGGEGAPAKETEVAAQVEAVMHARSEGGPKGMPYKNMFRNLKLALAQDVSAGAAASWLPR